ncbi:MAG: hypothetical protein H0T42_06920 [Deltaproteobacteria bacterium]|nr:hypothetical protein [Deltaproteobacteria bacterium]
MRSLSLVCLLLALTSVARAEDLGAYDTEGDAELSGSDPRVAALDEAFARAVTLAISDVVAPDVRSAKKAELDRELVGRARLWVAKFTVVKDTTAGDRRQLKVTVRVDRDKVRAKLAEMKIPTMTAGEASKGRAVTVLLRVGDRESVRATFGASAEKELPGLGALSSALRTGGMTVKRAPAAGPAARADGELPLSDEDADALAASAKADLAAIAGVSIGDAVPVRGIASNGVLVTAHVRLIDRRGKKLVGQGTATTAARGTDPAVIKHAVDAALVGAITDVLPPTRQALTAANGFTGEDTPAAEPGVVLVRMSPKTPWGIVNAELKYLQGAKGVQRAVLRRLSPGGWVIGVTTTESVERIAQIAKKPPATDTFVEMRINADIIELTLSGAP